MSTNLSHIPREHVDMIRKLGREGVPTGRIAFLTHMSENTVREILAESVNTTNEEPPVGGKMSSTPSH